MESLLVQVFATLLTLSQVFAQPQDLKTAFDPAKDQAEVVSLLRQGCSHMRRAFEIEDLNLDDLVATAMDDPEAHAAKFRGVSFAWLGECHAVHTAVGVAILASRPAGPLESRSSAGVSVSRQTLAAVIRSSGTRSGPIITRGLREQAESLPAAICGRRHSLTGPDSAQRIHCSSRYLSSQITADADRTAFRYPDSAPN